jgi:hypothetical protein
MNLVWNGWGSGGARHWIGLGSAVLGCLAVVWTGRATAESITPGMEDRETGDRGPGVGPVLSGAQVEMFRANTADESSGELHIPEPMVFDLVRPLGAKRGEFEVNTLVRWVASGEGPRFQWAPEIEYAVWDGHAVELELPFSNTRSEALKVAYQMTLPTRESSRFVHGLQLIGERLWLGERGHVLQPLYLTGYATRGHTSFMAITGARLEWSGSRMDSRFLINPSVFHNLNQQLAVGLETNWEFAALDQFELRVMPQLHMELGLSTSLQMGVGLERSVTGDVSGVVAFRVIRTF